MTVPGKGGRSRKWRSDADRVRACRARQRGEHEPPALEQALATGDDLAEALDKIRQLQSDLHDAGKTITGLRKDLTAAREDLRAQQRRFSWIESARDEAPRQRDKASAALSHERSHQTLPGASPPADTQPQARPTRAERRGMERERRRRGSG